MIDCSFKKLSLALVLFWSLASFDVSAEEPSTSGSDAPQDPCAQVPCSGHGNCLVKDHGPVCACHEGYRPDAATGLNCIAIEGTASSVPAANVDDGLVDLEKIKSALSEYSHEEDFARWGRLKAAGRFQGTFLEYKKYRVQKRKPGAIVMISLGAVNLAAFVATYAVGFTKLPTDDVIPFFGAGGIALAVGIPLVAVGAIRMSRTKRMLEGLRSIDAGATKSGNAAPRFVVLPLFDRQSSTIGLSGILSF